MAGAVQPFRSKREGIRSVGGTPPAIRYDFDEVDLSLFEQHCRCKVTFHVVSV